MNKLFTLLLTISTLYATAQTPCENGMAGDYPCAGIDMLAHISAQDLMAEEHQGIWLNDIWGWTDPMDDKEYAIIGMSNGTSFVDVTDPINPVFLGILLEHNSQGKSSGRFFHDGAKSVWRDIKVHSNHAYIVSEDPDHGMQVFDLTQLRGVTTPQTFPETNIYQGIGKAHNIVVNEETGFAYAVGANSRDKTCTEGGLHIIDLSDPANPVYRACFDQDGYTHDAQCVIYHGPDTEYQGKEICFNANENSITIVDVNDKDNISMVSRTTYTNSEYAHQGWLTEDHKYLLTNDELDELRGTTNNTKTLIWDVSDLDAPVLMGSYLHETNAIDHNLYIKDGLVYESNYTHGLRVLDAADVANANLTEIAFFDSYPSSNVTDFFGTWSNYPFFESGTIILSDITGGLFVLKVKQGFVSQQPEDTQVCSGESLELPVNIIGQGLTYQWQANSEGSFENLNNDDTYSNTQTATLNINNATKDLNGVLFRCVANDGLGNEYVTSSAALEVLEQPIALFDFVADGNTVSFTNNSSNADTYTWEFGDGRTSTEENPSNQYIESGVYEVSLTATSGSCTKTLTQSIDLVFTGLDNKSLKNQLFIYPNPAKDQLTVFVSKSMTEKANLILYNTNGKQVVSSHILSGAQQVTLDVSSLPDGLYFLSAANDQGVFTQKVIIE